MGCAPPEKKESSADSPAETGPLDADNDGYAATEDCDDTNAAINPGVIEICNELDDNFDSLIDTDATSYYLDADTDADGIADDGSTVTACTVPEGYGALTGDCDDTNAVYHPDADESDCFDPSDYNCDVSAGEVDNESDGFYACEACDDGNAAVNLLAAEVCNDNCDSVTDTDAADAPTWYTDADTDGDAETAVVNCETPDANVAINRDCEDSSASSNPLTGEPDCTNPNDHNCDGSVDYTDADGDGFAACSESATRTASLT